MHVYGVEMTVYNLRLLNVSTRKIYSSLADDLKVFSNLKSSCLMQKKILKLFRSKFAHLGDLFVPKKFELFMNCTIMSHSFFCVQLLVFILSF